MNLRPLGYEPSELPNCSTPRRCSLTLWGAAARGKSCGANGALGIAPLRLAASCRTSPRTVRPIPHAPARDEPGADIHST